VETIKTIGDASMVAAGLPEHCEDHAGVIGRYLLQPRGMMDIKGKGLMPVYLLQGRREA